MARQPQTLGKIERFWGTLWRECVEAAVFADLGDAMRGRRPPGPEIVDRLQGSPQAKRRAQVILRTLRGELSQVEAARILAMTPQWFDVLRRRFLELGLAGLEEQPMGRPRKPVSAEQQRIEELGMKRGRSSF